MDSVLSRKTKCQNIDIDDCPIVYVWYNDDDSRSVSCRKQGRSGRALEQDTEWLQPEMGGFIRRRRRSTLDGPEPFMGGFIKKRVRRKRSTLLGAIRVVPRKNAGHKIGADLRS